MPNTDQAQVPLRALYDQLDHMRDLLKIVDANYKVGVGGGMSVPLAPAQVQALKDQYVQLLSAMQQNLKNFPNATAYFP